MNIHDEYISRRIGELYGATVTLSHQKRITGNRIFEVTKDEIPYILRLSEYTPEKEEYISCELSWMKYLSDSISSVVRPQLSLSGNLYEIAETPNDKTIICMMEKAEGTIADPDDSDIFNPDLFYNLGSVMGDMHRLTRTYEGNIRKYIFEWNGPASAWRINNVIEDAEVRKCQERYYKNILSLPITKDNYGLIHWDIHTDNFFVKDGKIKLFDFNSFQTNWYVADMASAIFFMLLKGCGPLSGQTEKERTDSAEEYITSYLSGYMTTGFASKTDLANIDLFVKYQMTDEYLAAQLFWDGDEETRLYYLDWHRQRLTDDRFYVDVDLEKIIESVIKK